MSQKRLLKRLALAGTHGSGKTTLANLLGDRLQLPVINVSAPTATAKNMGYVRASDVPHGQMELFQWLSLFEQNGLERAEGSFVSHRSSLDFLAYAMYQVPNFAWAGMYGQVAVRLADRYDAIIFLPPNPDGVEDDGRRHVRDADEVDANIHRIIQKWHIPEHQIIQVTSNGPEFRVSEVLAGLRERGFERGDLL